MHAMSPEQAIATAIDIAGVSDFGAEGWRDGLTRSLAAFATMPLLPEVKRAAIDKIVQDLVTRLRIEQWFKQHPEQAHAKIAGPVVVVGLPRTGTTATVGMMGCDTRFRFLRAWEANQPLPPPIAGEEDHDPRVIAARKAAASYATPNMHIHDADGPMEDLATLGGLDMHAYHGAFPMPDDYVRWWMRADFASFYAFEARLLKLLQSRRGSSLWLLKSPPHLFQLEHIVKQYPDVKFVMTHRDPAKVIASVASMQSTYYEKRCLPGSIDRKQVGPALLSFWTEGMSRALAARNKIGGHRFIDVTNDEVVKQPIATFERIYQFLGMPLTPELIARLEAYNRDHAPGSSGAHQYSAEEHGLDRERIRTAFREYVERFGV